MSSNISSMSSQDDHGVSAMMSQAVSVAGDPNTSSLQHFVKAKKKINEIFADIAEYVSETVDFILAIPAETQVIPESAQAAAEDIGLKVTKIQEVLQRDHMKVAFFGRTSNGKSTTINSLLGDKILPTGIGHTTSCFLQVEGSHTGEAYLTTQSDQSHQPLQNLGQLGNALCAEKLDPMCLVRIHWPVEKCRLLGEEVVIIDSPGIDVEADLDEWIDKHCLDSDVFVLVANAESTIMLTEKKFFHKVSEKLSNPNIFILHNRWDASAGEDQQDQVKNQHKERAVAFLSGELKICTKEEALDRIFFISAKEALQKRVQEAKGQPPNIHTEDHVSRYMEYSEFERKLEQCLSSTAVKTKFSAHTSRAKDIVSQEGNILSQVQEAAARRRQTLSNNLKELRDRLDFTSRQLEMMTLESKDKICALVEDVEYKVAKALSEEIRRLSVLVDEFNDPFHPDPLVVNVYKSKLNSHLENGVGSNLKARLSSDLQLNMETQQKDMMERMMALLPLEKQTVSRNILPRHEAFEVLYHLNCGQLCSDFQEDLNFKFSLGLKCLFNRFMAAGQAKRRQTHQNIPRSLSSFSTPETPSNEFVIPTDDWGLASTVALASISSQGSMGALLVGGLLLKTVGWRVIAVSLTVYGAVYGYERLTWTTQAKLKEFKRQYVEHAARKLRLIVDMTSANCSHQVQQELSSTFARLCHMVDESTTEMKDLERQMERSIKELEEIASRSKVLKNQSTFLSNKLELFESSYLKTD